jgi:hypothetical protein
MENQFWHFECAVHFSLLILLDPVHHLCFYRSDFLPPRRGDLTQGFIFVAGIFLLLSLLTLVLSRIKILPTLVSGPRDQ